MPSVRRRDLLLKKSHKVSTSDGASDAVLNNVAYLLVDDRSDLEISPVLKVFRLDNRLR